MNNNMPSFVWKLLGLALIAITLISLTFVFNQNFQICLGSQCKQINVNNRTPSDKTALTSFQGTPSSVQAPIPTPIPMPEIWTGRGSNPTETSYCTMRLILPELLHVGGNPDSQYDCNDEIDGHSWAHCLVNFILENDNTVRFQCSENGLIGSFKSVLLNEKSIGMGDYTITQNGQTTFGGDWYMDKS